MRVSRAKINIAIREKEVARKERGRVFCIHPGDAPRRRIASRDSHHECLTTLSLCRYGRFNFFAIMTGSLFPRGDKVAGKILCYAPMALPPPFLSFLFPLLLYSRTVLCTMRVSSKRYLHSVTHIFSFRISNLINHFPFWKNIFFVLCTLIRWLLALKKNCIVDIMEEEF